MKKQSNKKIGADNFAEPEQVNEQQNTGESLDTDFDKFESADSDYIPEFKEPKNIVEPVKGTDISDSVSSGIKMKMFIGFALLLLTGANTFILNYIKNTKVPYSKMALTSDEIDEVMMYFDDPAIIEFVNKIPGWIIGVAHIEYMIFSKHSDLADEYKIVKKEKPEKISDVKNDSKKI